MNCLYVISIRPYLSKRLSLISHNSSSWKLELELPHNEQIKPCEMIRKGGGNLESSNKAKGNQVSGSAESGSKSRNEVGAFLLVSLKFQARKCW
ncbi:hypothetical protein NC652_003115 [Populus alba x Populus x berolinensis]|nr:hypothetical protein NC652_003115 [Populus alba x Populus x berolinensis]